MNVTEGTAFTVAPAHLTQELEKERAQARQADFEAAVLEVFDGARNVLLSKHADYGSKNIAAAPGGALNGLRVRMHDKIARINHLVDQQPENESLRDSFLDLANYALIGVLVLDGDWPAE